MLLPRLPVVIFALLLIATLLVAGDKKKNTGGVSSVKVIVLKDDNGKPIRNAAVIFHPVGGKGKQSKGGFELKTDNEGKTGFDGIPYGTLRVQVLANGFQTFGEDYEVNQPEQEITVRLKRPQDQYTIYDKSSPPKQ